MFWYLRKVIDRVITDLCFGKPQFYDRLSLSSSLRSPHRGSTHSSRSKPSKSSRSYSRSSSRSRSRSRSVSRSRYFVRFFEVMSASMKPNDGGTRNDPAVNIPSVICFHPGPRPQTPAADTSTPVLVPPTPTATVTNAPLRHPHRLRLESATIPGPSRRRIIAKKPTTVGTTVKNPPLAGAAPGGGGNAVRKAAAPKTITGTISVREQIPAWSWTSSVICSGKGTTKSGVTNISTATSATSTSCLLLCSVSLRPLVLIGRAEKETWARTLAAGAITAGAAPTRTLAPLSLARPATVAPQHLSLPATVGPLRLIHPIPAVPLRLTCPVMAAQRHPSGGLQTTQEMAGRTGRGPPGGVRKVPQDLKKPPPASPRNQSGPW